MPHQTRFLCRALGAVVALLCLAASLARAQVYHDGTFADQDWTTTSVCMVTWPWPEYPGFSSGSTSEQVLTGGHPGAHRRIHMIVPATTRHSGILAYTMTMFDGFSYDPSVSGPLRTFSLSADCRSSYVGWGFAIEQAGHYWGSVLDTPQVDSWFGMNLSVTEQRPWSGEAIDQFEGVPDLVAGGPIRFGVFQRRYASNGGAPSQEIICYLDNWTLAIPEPGGLALSAAIAIALVHRRRVMR